MVDTRKKSRDNASADVSTSAPPKTPVTSGSMPNQGSTGTEAPASSGISAVTAPALEGSNFICLDTEEARADGVAGHIAHLQDQLKILEHEVTASHSVFADTIGDLKTQLEAQEARISALEKLGAGATLPPVAVRTSVGARLAEIRQRVQGQHQPYEALAPMSGGYSQKRDPFNWGSELLRELLQASQYSGT